MRFGDDGVEMKASSTGAGSDQLEMIMVGKAMYMKSPELGTGLGDKWLRIDLSDPNSLFGMIGKATDPEVMFKAMEEPRRSSSSSEPRTSTGSRPTTTGSPSTRRSTSRPWSSRPRWRTCCPTSW